MNTGSTRRGRRPSVVSTASTDVSELERGNSHAMGAIGFIECKGLTGAVEAADAASKAANVTFIGYEKVGSGIVTVLIRGEVGAVQAAVEAAGVAASRVGELLRVHVIPRLHPDVERMLPKTESSKGVD